MPRLQLQPAQPWTLQPDPLHLRKQPVAFSPRQLGCPLPGKQVVARRCICTPRHTALSTCLASALVSTPILFKHATEALAQTASVRPCPREPTRPWQHSSTALLFFLALGLERALPKSTRSGALSTPANSEHNLRQRCNRLRFQPPLSTSATVSASSMSAQHAILART